MIWHSKKLPITNSRLQAVNSIGRSKRKLETIGVPTRTVKAASDVALRNKAPRWRAPARGIS